MRGSPPYPEGAPVNRVMMMGMAEGDEILRGIRAPGRAEADVMHLQSTSGGAARDLTAVVVPLQGAMFSGSAMGVETLPLMDGGLDEQGCHRPVG